MGCFRSSDGLHFNPLWHTISILLDAIALVLLMVVLLYNAPLDHVHSTLEGKVGLRMWLLTVNETSGPLHYSGPPLHVGKAIRDLAPDAETSIQIEVESQRDVSAGAIRDRSSADDNVDSLQSYSEQSTEVDAGDESDLATRADVVAQQSGLHAYGFGIWGWCQWTNTNWRGDAKCTKKAFWTFPDDADGTWDSINQIRWPDAIASALSGVSFLIVFAPVTVLGRLLLLLISIRFPGPYPALTTPFNHTKWPSSVRNSYQTSSAWVLRSWKYQLVGFAGMLCLVLPTVVTVLVGRGDVNGQDGPMRGKVGNGFSVLLGAWGCTTVAQILCMWNTGLVIRRPGKERSKKSKG
ncbi:hypothetical protein IAR55_006441 [Kwoniella newhampshirensis]|uniref:Uncharacterized protein n=1 Tax=Kwoniella newhampshirensis TaxID=1651941 RepID=A0AAW0YE54_9TREE